MNKLIKLKIRALALTVFLILTASVNSEAASYSFDGQASDIVVSLGFMKYMDNGDFAPDDGVTRAEFASYVYSLLGSPLASENRYYKDVTPGDGFAGEINTLTAYGLMNGIGKETFSPDMPILYEQAVKTLIIAAGYDVRAESKGGFPLGYISVANDIGLLSGVKAPPDGALSRGIAARLLYNAMNVEVLDIVSIGETVKFQKTKGRTVLNVYSSVYQIKGIVAATEYSGISMPSGACREGYIKIGSLELNVGFTNADDYLGYHALVYYKQESDADAPIIKSITPTTQNEALEIAASDIKDFADNTYTYEVNGVLREKKISLSADLIFNKKAYSDMPEKNIYMPGNGKVTLLDNNGDSQIDVIIVSSYKTYFVSRINSFDLAIADKYIQPIVRFDGQNKKYKILKDGEEVGITAIKENSIVMIYADKEKLINGVSVIDDTSTLYTAILCSDSVTGTVDTSDSEGNVSINGASYKISADFMAAASVANSGALPIDAGDTGVYYLDNNGLIAGTTFKRLDLGGYGFLVGIGNVTPVSSTIKMKIFTSGNGMQFYDAADKIEYNGIKMSSDAAVNMIQSSAVSDNLERFNLNGIQQLVHYTLNNEQKITQISTAALTPSGADLGAYGDIFSLDKKYSVTIYNDRDILASQYRVTPETKRFLIPVAEITEKVDNNGILEDVTYLSVLDRDDEFLISPLGNGEKFSNAALYDVSADDLSIRAIVMFDSSGAGGAGVANPQDAVIVDSVSKVINDKGEETVKIKGFRYGGTVELTAKNIELQMKNEEGGANTWRNCVNLYARDLVKGDVFQYTSDSLGYVSAIRVLAHDLGNITSGYEGINSGVINELALAANANYEARLYYHESYFGIGRVENILSGVALTYVQNKSWAEQNGGNDTPDAYARTRSYFKQDQTIVYVFDVRNNTIRVGDFSNIEANDMLAVHIRGGNVKTMLTIKK